MSVPAGQLETAAFLEALAGAPPVETHISAVFLGSGTAWKLKKAVRLPFLDFTVLDVRRRFCEREFELNARGAPGLYRDVVPVVRRADGSLALGGEGEPIDWIVRMARVPADDFLDVRAARGELSPGDLDRIADAVSAWHAAAPVARGVTPAMRWIVDGNVTSATEAGLPGPRISTWHAAASAALARLDPWCRQRAQEGFVRRCHGDLHLGNLCLWNGEPVLFDALEFDERLATIDVAYDLAFLLMDLERRLDRAAANRVLNRYVARTGDADLVRGLPVFVSVRAMVRAHVEARSNHPDAAGPYLCAALAALEPRPPVVVAIGGLPGSGKSTLARALAPALGTPPGALVLRSDEIRKRQHGVAPEERLPRAAYTRGKSEAVFAELAALAEVVASGLRAVIADATFIDPADRAAVERAARRAGVPFAGLWLTAPRAMLEQRVAARTTDASDATVAVVRAAHDPGPGGWHAIPATDRVEALALAKQALRNYIVS